MKGPYHYGAYKKTKSCGRSVYKKDKPTYREAFDNMLEDPTGSTRSDKFGNIYSNDKKGFDNFRKAAKDYNAKKAAKTVTETKPKKEPTIKAPNTRLSLSTGEASALADLGYSKSTKRKMKRQALVNKVKDALRPTGQAAKDVAKIKGIAKRIIGDGSKRRANEARRARKRRNPGSRR